MTTVVKEEEPKTEQAVQPGQEQVEDKAGDTDGVDTAATEKLDGDGFSIEEIGGSEVKPQTDEEVLGVTEKAQERLDKKIGTAITDKKKAETRASVAEKRVAELEASQAAPKDRPKAPLERNFDTDEDYQTAMDKYQTDTVAFNTAIKNVETQEIRDTERVKTNDDRLVVQMRELQKKYPDIDIKETIAGVADVQGFGNAAGFIADSEHNGRIALFLAKNESERIRIGNLTDAGTINREIGKLEERFTSVRKKITNAPKSLDTIDNKSETVEPKSIYEIKDNSEFLKARNKEARGGGQRK